MIELRQSTDGQEVPLGYFLDSTNGNDEETGLTIANTDIKIWKWGATTLASKNSGGATHISNGIYYATLDATDTNTLGPLVMFIHVSGALSVKVECAVLPANVWDAKYGSDKLQVDVTQIGGVNQTGNDVGADVDAILADTNELQTNQGNWTTATTVALNAQGKAEVNAEVVDALNVDTYAEPGQGAPPATTSLIAKIGYLYKAWRNKTRTTETQLSIYNDAGDTVDHKAPLSDDGTNFDKSEIGSGP